MAVKTITIDLDAYDALRRRKRKGQSFSDVIKEHFRSRGTGKDLLEAAGRIRVSEDALKAIDREIEKRRSSPARSARL